MRKTLIAPRLTVRDNPPFKRVDAGSRTSLGNFHSANAFLYVDDEGKEEEEED